MSGKRMCFWCDLSIHNKLLVIMLPLVVLPILVLGVVVLDLVSPRTGSQYTTGVIGLLLGILTVLSLGVAGVLSVTLGRWLTSRLHGLAEAANRLAAGHRSVEVASDSRDEIGRLADALNAMATSLTQHEAACQRQIDEIRTLHEISQEITAQVALEPVLHLIVERAHQLLQAEVSLLALRQDESDTFVMRAHSGTVPQALATLRLQPGEGLGGLEVIARQRPDVVLLDLLMPQMDGFAVIAHLQQEAQYRQLPIIVCTAKTLTASERAGLEQSVRTVLQKQGLDREALIQEVRGMLQAYHGPIVEG